MLELKDNPETITQFYNGKSIFITGFSGFMGKVLVEKILRSCPGVNKIYVHLREKKGLSPVERLESILNLPLFEKVKNMDGLLENRIIPMEGELTLPNLGLSENHLRILREEVSIIFHVAASVRFDDPLAVAIDVNTASTKSLVDIARTMEKIEWLVHLSTAYTNCDRLNSLIEEKMYPPHADWRIFLRLKEYVPEDISNILTHKFTGGMPNTYVFAKSLAEHIIADHSNEVPSIIIRPSIVVSTADEPIPGWIDNLNGPVGLLAGYGAGVVRTSICNKKVVPDYIPVDIATRAIVAAPWSTANEKEKKKLAIFNCCSCKRSVPTGEMVKMGDIIKDKYPMKLMIWKPGSHISSSKFWFLINVYLFHLLPAVFLDGMLKIIGRKPMIWRLQRKVYLAMTALLYFTMNQFLFDNSRLLTLSAIILDQDKEDFFFNRQVFDPLEYFEKSTVGFQKYILKQYESDRPAATRNLRIFTALDWIVKAIFFTLLAYYSLFVYNLHERVFDFIIWILCP